MLAICNLKTGTPYLTYLMPKRPVALAVPVESRIMLLRGQKIIPDTDLAQLYGISVGRCNEQVKRNQQRFPADFMFQLSAQEDQVEHGAIMAATVLNSKRAIEMSVFVVRAFVRMREMLANNRQLAAKINQLEHRLETHDSAIQELIEAIKELMAPAGTPRRKIGFQLPPAKA